MLRVTTTLILLGILCCCGADNACAKGGKGGGGKGRGGGSGFKSFGGKSTGRPTQRSGPGSLFGGGRGGKADRVSPASPGNGQRLQGSSQQPRRSFSPADSPQRPTGRDHARSVQRLNEERKLSHRQQTAQKLREIAERNGNDNLLQTADRMDQKAIEHYEKRLAKIDGTSTGGEPVNVNDLGQDVVGAGEALQEVSLPDPPLDESVLDAATPLSEGLSDNLARRLVQEDRKLQHQLDVAQHLRDVAARNGNDNLLRAAERMETTAADRYQRQLEKLGLFEDAGVLDGPLVEPPI